MGWSIGLLDNTIVIDGDLENELRNMKNAEEIFGYDYPDNITYKGHLSFNTDHMEHMDYMWNKELQKVLKKNKVKGDVTFGSLEGDNDGSFWGYRFDGKGGMVKLTGKVVWEEQNND